MLRLGKISGWSRADLRSMKPGEFDEYLGLAVEEECLGAPEDMWDALME